MRGDRGESYLPSPAVVPAGGPWSHVSPELSRSRLNRPLWVSNLVAFGAAKPTAAEKRSGSRSVRPERAIPSAILAQEGATWSSCAICFPLVNGSG